MSETYFAKKKPPAILMEIFVFVLGTSLIILCSYGLYEKWLDKLARVS
ncbi:MAG: hypothetical protein ACFFDW_01020 [Candidatus Thorarchaeota archaeon]